MTIETFLTIQFVVLMAVFGIVIIRSTIQMGKEDKAREEHRKELAKWDEQKRQERAEWDKKAWEGRKERFARSV